MADAGAVEASAALYLVDMDDKSPWIGWTKQLVAQHQGEEGEEGAGGGETAKTTTLVFFRGAHLDERAKSRRDDAIRIIAALYGAVGAVSARANVVPLFQFCGWTLEKVLQAWDISAIYAAQPLCWQWLDACRASSALPPRVSLAERDLLSKFAPPAPSSSACFEGSGSKYECECSTSTCAAMDEVCVGGTFDRVHAGHRLLLASTAAVCRKIVYMGITGEALLAKKRHRELLEPFEARHAAAVGFIRAVNPDLQVAVGTLDDVTRAPMPREFFIIQHQVQILPPPILPPIHCPDFPSLSIIPIPLEKKF
mmetsp:Transcript_535/g.1067  ORF Transcript_535/g.1067 Transcript_535/m.1067 type:complete len:310 (-) Transcript_535:380-1309(-)